MFCGSDKKETDDIHLKWEMLKLLTDKKKEQGDLFHFNFKCTTTVILIMHYIVGGAQFWNL